MAGEQAYDGFDNFSLENEPKQKRAKQIPGSRFKSIFSGKGLMVLIFILLGVFLILLVTGVIKCSETNETVEEFQSQVQMQVSHALNNVSDRTELRELELHILSEVSRMSERVMAKLLKNNNLIKIMIRRLEMLPEPASQNLQCPRHWIYFNESCYYFSTSRASWNASNLYCSQRETHLLVINSLQEQHFATSETQSRRFWIGLTDHKGENKWQWIDGTDYTKSPTYWMPGEPNSLDESCAHLWLEGSWNDAPCTEIEYFVCEMDAQQ
ncbi:C-type lectin domain family 10 member A-like isoform X1 [Scyliorhinus canicula]|uniref:C-type lectin domain family 10 member A-like isoform X1 n=1 Tax=Scyliorhinus canicula TaxID=7830 RepID=UPI0018F27AAD|nr:C-type lectin domain family 10 member A-like isoform X1 [Scyliorhinus canicula]